MRFCSSQQKGFEKKDSLHDKSSDQVLVELERAFIARRATQMSASLRPENLRRCVRRKVHRKNLEGAASEGPEESASAVVSQDNGGRTSLFYSSTTQFQISKEAKEIEEVGETEEFNLRTPDNLFCPITLKNDDSAAALSRSDSPVYV